MENDLSPGQKIYRKFKRVLLSLVMLAVLGSIAWTWGALTYKYAIGERAGYLQKISQKGWICKTWEGELALANLPGAMPEIFHFSVRDDKIAQELMQRSGQRLSITYEQHRGIPTSCFGETPYFIVAVTPISENQPTQKKIESTPSKTAI